MGRKITDKAIIEWSKKYSEQLQKQGLTDELNYRERPKIEPKKIHKSQAEKLIKEVTESKKNINIKHHNTRNDVLKAIFDVVENKLPKKLKQHKIANDVIDAIFDAAKTTTKKTKSTPIKKDAIDMMAENIINNPEYNNINKIKFEKYSFDRINKFNERYPDILLKLFKTKEAVNTLLKKKSDKAQKRKLSEEKAVIRKKDISEKAKKERLEKKVQKYKHFDDMSDAELNKFKQARAYYMRKSKTSTILPKNLNKDDPETLTNVCKALAERGFDTMSEQLFMEEFEG